MSERESNRQDAGGEIPSNEIDENDKLTVTHHTSGVATPNTYPATQAPDRSWELKRHIILVTCSISLGFLFTVSHTNVLRALLLHFSVTAMLSIWVPLWQRWRFAPIKIPSVVRFQLIICLSAIVAAGWYLAVEDIVWRLCVAAIYVALLLERLFRIMLISLATTSALRSLYADFLAGVAPRRHPPHVFAWSNASQAEREFNRVFFQLYLASGKRIASLSTGIAQVFAEANSEMDRNPGLNANLRTRLRYGLRVIWRIKTHITPIAVISTPDVANESPEFVAWLGKTSVLYIAVLASNSPFVRKLLDLNAGEKEQVEILGREIEEMTKGIPMALRNIGRGGFDERLRQEGVMHRQFHVVPAPVLLLYDPMIKAPTATDESLITAHGYQVGIFSSISVVAPVAQMVELLAVTALPLSRSDQSIPASFRPIIIELAERGLAPLADCYLRFRLSTSHVERFLGIIDCFEVLIKWSVLAMAVARPKSGRSDFCVELLRRLERPSLGHWLEILRGWVAADCAAIDSAEEGVALRTEIAEFWRLPLTGAPYELIGQTKGVGLAWGGEMPRSHLEWLNWLVWLRNETKGHGSIHDGTCAPVWHTFHEALLTVVGGLRRLTLDSAVIVRRGGGGGQPEAQLGGFADFLGLLR